MEKEKTKIEIEKIGKGIEGVEVKEVPEKRVEPEITEEEESRKRKAEEEKRLKELEREESIERLRTIEKKEKERLEEELRQRILKQEKELEEKEKKKSIFEAIKELVGLTTEQEISYDDLIGDNSERAWDAREKEAEKEKEIIATAGGIETERARKFLEERLGKGEKQKNWKVINAGLMYNDTEWADKIREWLRYDKEGGMVSKIVSKIPKIREWLGVDKEGGGVRGGINAKIVKFLRLNKSEWWYERRKLLDKVLPSGFFIANQDLFHSEIGVSVKNETKRKLLDEFGKDFPADAILSFLGNASPEAQKMVEKYYGGDKRLEWAKQRYLESIYEKTL